MNAYAHFVYSGRNHEKVIAKLARAKIDIYSVKKSGENKMLFKCNIKDERKVFAIFDSSWYNIKRTKYSGAFYPFFFLWAKKQLLFGAAAFLAIVLISKGFIFSVEIIGSGVYENEIRQVLNDAGVRRFTSFSRLDKKDLESKICKIEGISFVSYVAKANRVILDVRLTEHSAEINSKSFEDIVSTVDGKVLSVTVLRGTSLVSVGEEVTVGQKLVGAYYKKTDEEIAATYVMATIEIETERKVEFKTKSTSDAAKNAAIMYAKFVVGEKDFKSFILTSNGGGFLVSCTYIELINGG